MSVAASPEPLPGGGRSPGSLGSGGQRPRSQPRRRPLWPRGLWPTAGRWPQFPPDGGGRRRARPGWPVQAEVGVPRHPGTPRAGVSEWAQGPERRQPGAQGHGRPGLRGHDLGTMEGPRRKALGTCWWRMARWPRACPPLAWAAQTAGRASPSAAWASCSVSGTRRPHLEEGRGHRLPGGGRGSEARTPQLGKQPRPLGWWRRGRSAASPGGAQLEGDTGSPGAPGAGAPPATRSCRPSSGSR